MKKFLRENPTIAFGLGLPLVLAVVFLLISGIPALLVAPPQYDVLYMTGYNNYPNGVQISVVNRKIQVVYLGGSAGYQKPRLWRYNPKTGGVQEITIMLPPGLTPPGQRPAPGAASKVTAIDVPDLDGLTIDPSSVAPDGYEFSSGANGYSGDVYTGLFYGARYASRAVLTKQGRSIRLPNSGNTYYSNNIRFIGWVVPK
ncbi:MAG: hypothetical protein LJE57_02645 [Gallionella sp.]|nr:hypothetical protein [Gallionella sp.]